MASLFENIRKVFSSDSGLRIRTAQVPTKNNELGISTQEDDITSRQIDLDGTAIDATDIEKFVTLSKYRDQRYQAFEEMLQDPIVAAALEMYADDATQYNRDGNIIWVESDDKVITDAGNRLLRILDIPNNAWRHIYSLCTYGDLYFRLYKDGDEPDIIDYESTQSSTIEIIPEDGSRHLEERIEYIANPATVFDLQEKDKTSGFIRTKSSISDTTTLINHNYIGNGFSSYVSSIAGRNCEMLNNKAFIHIMLSESINRSPEFLSIEHDDSGSSDVYKIKVGKSILEDAYPISRQLSLLQDSLLLNRMSKSAIIRLLQVEIGDAPKPEGENILRRVKNLIEQKMSVNTETGRTRSYNNPGPIENTIYIPTRNGKGAITSSTIGGEVDVKSIVDIDYFQNLKLAALKIPKQYLNFDSAEGFSNGTSLTKVSSRYAHTVMRIQTAYIRGITNLLNIFFIDKGLDYVNKFKIRMVSPSTIEDAERDDQFSDKISQTRDILDLVSDSGIDQNTRNQILSKLLSELVGVQEIAEIVKNATTNTDEENSDNTDSDNEFTDTPHDSFSHELDSLDAATDVEDFKEPRSDEFDELSSEE